MNRRHRRDALLGWGSVGLAASAALLVVSDTLALTDSLRSHQPQGFQIAAGCRVLLDLALIGAFACSSAAFLLEVAHRARRLELGATLAAVGATIGVAGGAIATITGIDHQFPEIYVLVLTLMVAARFASVFAALSTSKAFSWMSRTEPDVLARRDRKLAWASLSLAVSYALVMIGQIFLISYASGRDASREVLVGVSLNAAGAGLAGGAGAIGALAFYMSQHQSACRGDWAEKRDGLLGIATVVFACAFFVIGAGLIVQADGVGGHDASATAQFALAGASSVGNAVASVCASVGFMSSRRSIIRDAIDIAHV